jgi:hypothetical protein
MRSQLGNCTGKGCCSKTVQDDGYNNKLPKSGGLGAHPQDDVHPATNPTLKPINPVLACISLGVQRIYGSAENPYTPAISFLMLTWTLHKFSMLQRSISASMKAGIPSGNVKWFSLTVDVIYDTFIVSNMLFTGVIVQV